MRIAVLMTVLATALACSLVSAPAHARARVFVASYGNDANPCTFGSPCKTFQQAVNVVDPGGEVTAIDSAGFGPINITKAVTITSPAGVEAGVVPAVGGDGVDINAGVSDAERDYWHRPRHAAKCAREGPFAPFGSVTVMATLAPARDFAGAFSLLAAVVAISSSDMECSA
jgi:hypothetical protein